MLQPFDCLERAATPAHDLGQREVAELEGGESSVEEKADVRGGRPVRHEGGLDLHVVRYQPGVIGAAVVAEESPGLKREAAQELPGVRRELATGVAGRLVEPLGQRLRGRPQEQDRRRDQQRRRTEHGDGNGEPDHEQRHGIEVGVDRGPPGPVALHLRRRLPFEQVPLGDEASHQRADHRVHQHQRLMRQERQVEQLARVDAHQSVHRGAQLRHDVGEASNPEQVEQEQRVRRERDEGQGHDRPDGRGAHQYQPTCHEQHEREGLERAPPQVVLDLPARKRADRVRDRPIVVVGHPRQQPAHGLPVAPDPAVLPPIVGRIV